MAANRRDPRAVRAARRAAKASAGGTRVLPGSFTRKAITQSKQGQIDYAAAVQNGQLPPPNPGTLEGKALARVASWARWDKSGVDHSFVTLGEQYWYHIDDEKDGS
jgi:hypothetical protein